MTLIKEENFEKLRLYDGYIKLIYGDLMAKNYRQAYNKIIAICFRHVIGKEPLSYLIYPILMIYIILYWSGCKCTRLSPRTGT